MPLREKLFSTTRIPKERLPNSYQIIGDVMLLKFLRIRNAKDKTKVAEALLKLFPYIKTVCEIKEIRGELREPEIIKLAGDGTETVHKENGILYKLDVSKIMFSKGNLSERKRLIGQVKGGEIILDMFAGIGYFSLGLAKLTKAREILAIEKNPVAYNYLTENISLNKITNINAIQGDCRQFSDSFRKSFDRIIMGYLPNTEAFLPYALFMAKNGCIIHFHNTYKKEELWKKPIVHIEEACSKANARLEIISKKKVKSYSPNRWHVVIDFCVRFVG